MCHCAAYSAITRFCAERDGVYYYYIGVFCLLYWLSLVIYDTLQFQWFEFICLKFKLVVVLVSL